MNIHASSNFTSGRPLQEIVPQHASSDEDRSHKYSVVPGQIGQCWFSYQVLCFLVTIVIMLPLNSRHLSAISSTNAEQGQFIEIGRIARFYFSLFNACREEQIQNLTVPFLNVDSFIRNKFSWIKYIHTYAGNAEYVILHWSGNARHEAAYIAGTVVAESQISKIRTFTCRNICNI
jgi:hypothetical protein